MAGKKAKINAHLVVEIILKNLAPKPNKSDNNRIYPMYDGQSLVNVPHTIMNILGVKTIGIPINKKLYGGKIDLKGIRKVVVVFLDGFGYNMWLDSNSEPGCALILAFFPAMDPEAVPLGVPHGFCPVLF